MSKHTHSKDSEIKFNTKYDIYAGNNFKGAEIKDGLSRNPIFKNFI